MGHKKKMLKKLLRRQEKVSKKQKKYNKALAKKLFKTVITKKISSAIRDGKCGVFYWINNQGMEKLIAKKPLPAVLTRPSGLDVMEAMKEMIESEWGNFSCSVDTSCGEAGIHIRW